MKAFRCTGIVPDAFRPHKETAYWQRKRHNSGVFPWHAACHRQSTTVGSSDEGVRYFYFDLKRASTQFAPGIRVPLRPFPGVLGVARAEPGRYSTVPPGPFGGNMDVREMIEGTTVYLPVFVEGALLWSGDSHAAQGNGDERSSIRDDRTDRRT